MTQAKKTKPGENTGDEKERTSIFIKKELIRNLKYVAFMTSRNQTEVIDEALSEYVERWQKKNGPIPNPKT